MEYGRLGSGIRQQVYALASRESGGVFQWTVPSLSRLITVRGEIGGLDPISTSDMNSWTLTMSSSGFDTESTVEKRLTFLLKCAKWRSPNRSSSKEGIALRWKFSVLDARGEESFYKESDNVQDDGSFTTELVYCGGGVSDDLISVDLPCENLWTSSAENPPLVTGDTLNVRMRFEYVYQTEARRFETFLPNWSSAPSLESMEDTSGFLRLLKPGVSSDFTLVSEDNQEFAVHRTVLRARSEYFAAMLNLDCEEAKSGRCQLPDLNVKTLEVLLVYMYGGLTKVPDALVQLVFIAADKYQFALLKSHCEALLSSQMMLGTAAHFLILADKYSAAVLREACLKLAKANYSNFVEVGGAEELMTSGNTDLLNAVNDYVIPGTMLCRYISAPHSTRWCSPSEHERPVEIVTLD